jgi:uncharacterized membrane protein (UPF0127 family)
MPGRSSFIAPLRESTELHALLNDRTGRVVASAVELAETSETRRRGLLGRDSLDPSAALIIVPCSSVHTFFMRFVIDVVFVDRDGVVLKTVSDLRPWRIAIGARAHAVIELNAGGVRRSELVVGDRVSLRESTLRA